MRVKESSSDNLIVDFHLLALVCIHVEKAAFRMVAALIQAVTSEL